MALRDSEEAVKALQFELDISGDGRTATTRARDEKLDCATNWTSRSGARKEIGAGVGA